MKVHCRINNGLPQVAEPKYTNPACITKSHFNVLSSTPTALQLTFTFRCSEQNFASISHHRHAWHKISSDLITLILFGTFFRIFSIIFLRTLFLNVLSLCNSMWVRKQVSARNKRSFNINGYCCWLQTERQNILNWIVGSIAGIHVTHCFLWIQL